MTYRGTKIRMTSEFLKSTGKKKTNPVNLELYSQQKCFSTKGKACENVPPGDPRYKKC